VVNQEHLDNLKKGVEHWNLWRTNNPDIKPNLREANLIRADLNGANLREADLQDANLSFADLTCANLEEAWLLGADLTGACLTGADFIGAYLTSTNLEKANIRAADLTEADLWGADLTGADLTGADLTRAYLVYAYFAQTNLSYADLTGANLTGTDFTGANLSGTDFTGALLIRTNFTKATLNESRIYGISVWDIILTDANTKNLIITPPSHESTITIDNLEVAQFIYLLLNNEKIRDVIDTITSTVVLILGSFDEKQKPVLEALREELRKYNYTPVLFDSKKPDNRDVIETVSILARMARFVIADITDANTVIFELSDIVQGLDSVPVQPILSAKSRKDLSKSAWYKKLQRKKNLVGLYCYKDLEDLKNSLKDKIINPSEARRKQLLPKNL